MAKITVLPGIVQQFDVPNEVDLDNKYALSSHLTEVNLAVEHLQARIEELEVAQAVTNTLYPQIQEEIATAKAEAEEYSDDNDTSLKAIGFQVTDDDDVYLNLYFTNGKSIKRINHYFTNVHKTGKANSEKLDMIAEQLEVKDQGGKRWVEISNDILVQDDVFIEGSLYLRDQDGTRDRLYINQGSIITDHNSQDEVGN